MNISFETNLLLSNIVNSVRHLEERKSKVGDEATAFIKEVTQKLKSNKVPLVEVVLSNYVAELGYDIDLWVKWDGNIFSTSHDSNDDYKPILGQKVDDRVRFVKSMPETLKYIEMYFNEKISEITFNISEETDEDEEDLIPEEMSEEEKDFMMMDGIED